MRSTEIVFWVHKHFLTEYKEMCHRSEIINNEVLEAFFIPRLGVYAPDNNTTLLRVDVHTSWPMTNRLLFNAVQFKGEVPPDYPFSRMVGVRARILVFIADVKKMYNIIYVIRHLQRILWSKKIYKPMIIIEI